MTTSVPEIFTRLFIADELPRPSYIRAYIRDLKLVLDHLPPEIDGFIFESRLEVLTSEALPLSVARYGDEEAAP